MAALREIFAEFGVKFDRKRDLERGNRQVTSMRDRLQRLGPVVNKLVGHFAAFAAAIGGAVMVRAISSFLSGIIKIGDELDKVGQQVGMSTRELQAWRHAAELSGVDAAAFGNALGQLQRNAREAERGTSTMVEAFRDLGISVTDAAGNLKDPNTLLLEMADGLAGIDNETERTALAMTVLGRSGRRMLPLFANGSEGARAMLAELEELGGGMSDLAISESVKLNDEMTRLRLVMLSLKSAMAEDVLPRVRDVVTWFIEARESIQDLVKNTTVVRTVVIAAITAIVGVLLATFPVWGMFALMIAAVVVGAVAFALILDDIITTAEGGDSIFRRLGDTMGEMLVNFLIGMGEARQVIVNYLNAVVMQIQRVISAFETMIEMAARARAIVTGAMGGAVGSVGRMLGHRPEHRAPEPAGLAASLAADPAAQLRTMGMPGQTVNQNNPAAQLRTLMPGQTVNQNNPAAQLRTMMPGRQQTVNQNVQAPSTVTVNVTEAQNPQATAAAVRGQIDSAWQQQLRGLQAASVPQESG